MTAVVTKEGAPEPIRAAGVVVLRERAGVTEVLTVHRARYQDWTLPKGKVKPNEIPPLTAVRECDEETGVQVHLGAPLSSVSYRVGGRPKTVQYWVAASVAEEGVGDGDEVDEVDWCPVLQAPDRLQYPDDHLVVAEACRMPRTVPLIVLRHARAMKRVDFHGRDDAERPLTGGGRSQAKALVHLLDAYGITHVVSSDADRCWQTVRRYAKLIDSGVMPDRAFSEAGHAANEQNTRTHARRLAGSAQPTVICTHRPVLPTVLFAVAQTLGDDPEAERWDPRLRPGGCLVIHRGINPDGSLSVAATERHDPLPEDHR